MKQSVYIVQSGPHTKIGIANDIARRIGAMQTDNPTLTYLVAEIQCKKASSLEKWMHKRLRCYRRRGEWFTLPRKLLDFLESCENKKDIQRVILHWKPTVKDIARSRMREKKRRRQRELPKHSFWEEREQPRIGSLLLKWKRQPQMISVRVPLHLYADLTDVAKEYGVTISQAAQSIITASLNKV